MTSFCQNTLCRLHSVQVEEPQNVCDYVEANGKTVRAKRFFIRDGKNGSWFFCDICANAIAMVYEGVNKPS